MELVLRALALLLYLICYAIFSILCPDPYKDIIWGYRRSGWGWGWVRFCRSDCENL